MADLDDMLRDPEYWLSSLDDAELYNLGRAVQSAVRDRLKERREHERRQKQLDREMDRDPLGGLTHERVYTSG